MNQALIQRSIARVMPTALASGLFVSLCTIQQPDGLYVGSGQPSGNWINVSGLVDIPCMNAPESELRPTADEEKGELETTAFNLQHVLLDDYYPTIQTNWRAVIDGVAFDILGSESDSQRTQTRLKLQLAVL